MRTHEQCIAITSLTAMSTLRRRMIDLAERGKREVPSKKELYTTLKTIISQQFQREITPTIDRAIELCAERIYSKMTEYTEKDPDYELIDFICYAEKYLRNEIMSIDKWCSLLVPINY
jgi:hypothetical protein